jgi:anti-sigma-K factor RskA
VTTVTCDQRRDLLLLYATDALEPSEAAEVRAHLASGCPQCAGALAEAQATVAHLPMGLEPVMAPTRARDRLMKRMAGESDGDSMKLIDTPTRAQRGQSGWRLFSTGAIAACLGALLAASVMFYAMREKNRLIGGSDVQVVSLNRAEAQPKAHGRVFWDRKSNEWIVFVFDMTPPPPGKAYELWFLPAGQKPVAGPTFTVDASGKARIRVAVPLDVGPLAAAAITDEPLGGSVQPSGDFQLHGEIK